MTTPFDHRMTVYGTDDQFLATALPFLTEGLNAAGEPPPVAIASPHNLALLRDALGADVKHVTLIDHAEWYTGSAANAVAQGAGYLAAHAGPGGRVHLLMEPVWNGRAGRSPREATEWIRYEALANLLFAPLATTALCAYDTRTAGPAIVDAARRAHPDTGVYEEPVRLVAELDAVPLAPPPPDAELLTELAADAVRDRARDRGLALADAELFGTAVAEAAEAVGQRAGTALLWGEGAQCVCELRSGRRVGDPLAGFVPPDAGGPAPGQGLWYARQVCAYVDVRDDRDGATVRLQYA
ncbi:MEDS domain-containing protein [Streptomyces sp. NPDC048420]|uniref:MEDS domain-containing protein n=1 Tax=Streptomyces sp. NPDC048420 TaxID=3155755 RepID=UPI00342D875B